MAINISHIIKNARKLKGYSLSALADIVNSSAGHLSDIENNKKFPGGELLISLSRTLEVDLLSQGSNAHHAKLVPVYGTVPAGWPEEPIDVVAEEVLDWIPVEGSINSIGALRVEGHSMAPEIRDGMYVLYIKDYDIKPGDVIVATDEFNRALVKQYVLKEGEPWLVSINQEYPSFKINENYRIVGRVFEKHDKSRVGRGR